MAADPGGGGGGGVRRAAVVVGVRAQGLESPYAGRLAKAVFLSDRVPEALAEVAAKAPPAAREALVAAAARAKQPEPALATPAGPPEPTRRVQSRAPAGAGAGDGGAGGDARGPGRERRGVRGAPAVRAVAGRGRAGHRDRARPRRTGGRLPEGAPRVGPDAVSLPLPDGAVPPRVRGPGIARRRSRARRPRPRNTAPSGSGPWRRRIRCSRPSPKTSTPSSTSGAPFPTIPGTSTPTPAAATNELGACSEHAPSNLQKLRYRLRHDQRTHGPRRPGSLHRAGGGAGADQPRRKDDPVSPRCRPPRSTPRSDR